MAFAPLSVSFSLATSSNASRPRFVSRNDRADGGYCRLFQGRVKHFPALDAGGCRGFENRLRFCVSSSSAPSSHRHSFRTFFLSLSPAQTPSPRGILDAPCPRNVEASHGEASLHPHPAAGTRRGDAIRLRPRRTGAPGTKKLGAMAQAPKKCYAPTTSVAPNPCAKRCFGATNERP